MKICPLCQRPNMAKFPNGDLVIDKEDIDGIRLWGLNLKELHDAVIWARTYGWKENRVGNDSKGER